MKPSGAIFSECRTWRYFLWRRWDMALPVLICVLLNPSVAGEVENDHTVTKGDICVSIHMPRWASRITLEITEVRVERVQEISHRDALAEGVSYDVSKSDGNPCARYRQLWDKINPAADRNWKANPWVWALSLKRVK